MEEPIGRQRKWIVAGIVLAAVSFFALCYQRYATFHNQTFDLAMYARMAWGMARFDGWEPIMNAHFAGLHLSWVLWPLGVLGAALGTVPVLLAAQSIALAVAAWPIANIGARHGGKLGLYGAAAYLLYPNLWHVATYEFHPGTLAVLPIAWMLDAIDRRSVRAMSIASFFVLVCREDLALVVIAGWLLFLWARPVQDGNVSARRTAYVWIAFSTIYIVIFAFELLPQFGPDSGSLQQHFGGFGQRARDVAWNIFFGPVTVFKKLFTTENLKYLFLILTPLLLLPLRASRWLVVAAPTLLIALLSSFHTTTEVYSHYLTPAVPVLVVAATVGLAEVVSSYRKHAQLIERMAWIAAILGYVSLGGGPLSLGFDTASYVDDERALAAQRIIDAIPTSASVQAPDSLLPHLCERTFVRRSPPATGDVGFDWVVLDTSHRVRYPKNRWNTTIEEPLVQRWLQQEGYVQRYDERWFLVLQKWKGIRDQS